jgi:hypothetical protein
MSDAAAPGPRGRPIEAQSAFSARTVIALLVAGVFAFSAMAVLSAYAPDLRGGGDGGAHALSRSAVGFAGLSDLLKAMGEPVVVSRDASGRTSSTSLLILTPDTDVDKTALNNLTNAGPTLVVLPKWEAASDRDHPGWVLKVGASEADDVAKVLDKRLIGVKIVRDAGKSPVQLTGLPGGVATTGPIDQLQTMTGDPDPLIRDARGRAILSESSDGNMFVLSDPDLLNTQGLKDLATAQAGVGVVRMLRKGDGPVMFDVTLNGFNRSRNLLKLAFAPPFLGATLCLAAAALLMALQVLTRFGSPRPSRRAIALGKQALADNSAALIRLARREPKMAGRYLDLTRTAVAKALGVGPMKPDELDALLDRQAARSGGKHNLGALKREAATVADRAGLMRLARDLHAWKMEMTGERR